jgi:hypothetical protein
VGGGNLGGGWGGGGCFGGRLGSGQNNWGGALKLGWGWVGNLGALEMDAQGPQAGRGVGRAIYWG